MKRFTVVLALVALLVFSLSSFAFAAEDPVGFNSLDQKFKENNWKFGLTAEQMAELKGRDVKDRVKVNGKTLDYDVPPVIKEGRTLIPVRAITRGLGATVDWDDATKTITIKRDDITVIFTIGKMELYVNGVKEVMDVPAQLICNRTFVPLRFIAQALGDRVKYDPDTGDIDIDNPEQAPAAPTAPVVDDVANTFGWTLVPGYSALSQYQYSTDKGVTWQTCTANPQSVGNNKYDTGAVLVRVKADTALDTPAGKALASNAPFTITTIIEGSISALSSTEQVSVSYNYNGSVITSAFQVKGTTQVLINDQAAQFTNLQIADAVKITLQNDDMIKLEVTR